MAFFKGSFYEKLKVFDPPKNGRDGFRGVRARPVGDPEPVLEHTIAVNDRLDTLAQNYYANPRDWRRLADCNANTIFPEDMIYEDVPGQSDEPLSEKLGNVLLVPRRREGR